MAEDLLRTLMRFHREVVLPDIKQVVGAAVDDLDERMAAHFAGLYKRFERLETECHQVRHLEERLGA
jgi:hypothetical protein